LRKPKKRRLEKQQPYDTTFKAWIRGQPEAILPVLVPGVTLEGMLDVEVIRPTMRMDKVFKVKYHGVDSIANFEFETGTNNDIVPRMLAYNAILYHDYGLPVISMIIYPFRTKMAESPLNITSGPKRLITFDFLMLPFFMEEAEHYIREHIACMYPVLPTMRGANDAMIKQAMAELTALYREDEVSLSQQFVWMNLLLERTDTIALEEKQKIKERLKMYDPLWEEHPKIKQIRAESKAEGEAIGIAEGEVMGIVKGEILALQRTIVNIVKARFPDLAELAQKQVTQINDPGALDLLVQKVSTAPDEVMVRWLLSPSVA
jgi:predicted transposase YdaD